MVFGANRVQAKFGMEQDAIEGESLEECLYELPFLQLDDAIGFMDEHKETYMPELHTSF